MSGTTEQGSKMTSVTDELDRISFGALLDMLSDPARELASLPVGDPVPIYGEPDLLCAELYSALWERHKRGEQLTADRDEINAELDETTDYLAALLLARLAVSADLEIPASLAKEIASVLGAYTARPPRFDHARPWREDHNEADLVFDRDDLASEWLGGEILRMAELSVEGSGIYDDGDDIVAMARDGNKPYLRSDSMRQMQQDMFSVFSFVTGSISCGIGAAIADVEEVERFRADDGDADDRPAYPLSFDGLRALAEEGALAPDETCVILESSHVDDETSWLALSSANLLCLMGALPEGCRHIVALTLNEESECQRASAASLLSELGLSVFCDVTGDDARFPQTSPGTLLRCPPRYEVTYAGELSQDVLRRMDAVVADEEISYALWTSFLREKAEHPEHGARPEHMTGVTYKQRREVFEQAASILSFGTPSFGGEELTGADMPSSSCDREDLRRTYDALSSMGRDLPPLPVSTAIRLARTFQQDVDGKDELDHLIGSVWRYGRDEDLDGFEREAETKEELLERAREFAEHARSVGAESAVEAVRSGVPLEDVLA